MVDSLLNSRVPAEPGPRSAVMREIIRNIEAGNYAVGQPLPSTRKLSETLNVHRGTITRAFSLLEDEGYLKIGANGMRIVASKSNQASKFVGQSIAMLIMPPESWRENSHESGWLEYIDRGMFEQIRAEKLHAMWLHPDLVNEAMVSDLMRNRPQGIVVGEHAARLPGMVSLLEPLHRSGLPMVVYGDAPKLAAFDRVVSDHELGAYDLTKWLISRGCKRIVMLFGENRNYYWSEGRIRGCRRALEEAGLPLVEPVYAVVRDERESNREIFDENVRTIAGHIFEHIGSNRVDAILCASDCLVFPVAALLKRAGWEPNKDVLITGYDNYWQEAPERAFLEAIPAATVDKLNPVIGKEMVKLLLERISGKLPDEPQRRVVAAKMIVTEK